MTTDRIALRCPSCQLNQFLTANGLCRKCEAPLVPDEPQVVAVEVHPEVPEPKPAKPEGILAQVEKTAIEAALEMTGNNIRAAARALGIGKTTLYRKWRMYTRMYKLKLEAAEEKIPTQPVSSRVTLAAIPMPPPLEPNRPGTVAPVQPEKDLLTLYQELITKGVLLADKSVSERLKP